MIVRTALLVACAGLVLSGCASVTPMPEGFASPSNHALGSRAASRPAYGQGPAQSGPRYKVGAPYQAGGVWYVPAEQPAYDEVGLASWYGDDFNGKPTANGELFDMNGVSGAHATLPMPSIVEVTNLENGKSIQVRLNDRGPFHPGRIIDLSRGAAQQLGYYNKGTAQVRVRFIKPAPLIGVDAPVSTYAANPMRGALASAPVAPRNDYVGTQASGYAVQAGAFSNRVNAERVAAVLASAGRTSIQPMDHAGSHLFRVTVGSWMNAQEAGAAREKVAALGFSQARVIGGS